MTSDESSVNAMFLQLVMSLEAAALQQMGKLQNPFTGKIEKNLEMCKGTIDMLEMIESKTRGNLSQEEESLIKRTLYHLRMNYVDELKSSREESETSNESKEATSSEQEEKEPRSDSDNEGSREEKSGN